MRFLAVILTMAAAVWVIWGAFNTQDQPKPAELEATCENKGGVSHVTHLRSGGWIVTCENEEVRYVPKRDK